MPLPLDTASKTARRLAFCWQRVRTFFDKSRATGSRHEPGMCLRCTLFGSDKGADFVRVGERVNNSRGFIGRLRVATCKASRVSLASEVPGLLGLIRL